MTLAALRHDRVEAPWLIEGPINGETFRLYIDRVLVPTLRPGDIVVMDSQPQVNTGGLRLCRNDNDQGPCLQKNP